MRFQSTCRVYFSLVKVVSQLWDLNKAIEELLAIHTIESKENEGLNFKTFFHSIAEVLEISIVIE